MAHAAGVRHRHVVNGVAHHHRLARRRPGLEQRCFEHGGVRLGGMAVGGLQGREARAHAVTREAGEQAAVAHPGRHAQGAARLVETFDERGHARIERLLEPALAAGCAEIRLVGLEREAMLLITRIRRQLEQRLRQAQADDAAHRCAIGGG